MINVYKITAEQRAYLIGQTFDGEQYFNTEKIDADGNYYVNQDEYSKLTLVRANEIGVISWWFTLPLMPYNPIIIE